MDNDGAKKYKYLTNVAHDESIDIMFRIDNGLIINMSHEL